MNENRARSSAAGRIALIVAGLAGLTALGWWLGNFAPLAPLTAVPITPLASDGTAASTAGAPTPTSQPYDLNVQLSAGQAGEIGRAHV